MSSMIEMKVENQKLKGNRGERKDRGMDRESDQHGGRGNTRTQAQHANFVKAGANWRKSSEDQSAMEPSEADVTRQAQLQHTRINAPYKDPGESTSGPERDDIKPVCLDDPYRRCKGPVQGYIEIIPLTSSIHGWATQSHSVSLMAIMPTDLPTNRPSKRMPIPQMTEISKASRPRDKANPMTVQPFLRQPGEWQQRSSGRTTHSPRPQFLTVGLTSSSPVHPYSRSRNCLHHQTQVDCFLAPLPRA
ncbi:hypothetical protein BJX62DRAFT_29436 [Aspergillus germanicus]